jgi:hypothetical protein
VQERGLRLFVQPCLYRCGHHFTVLQNRDLYYT